MKTDTGQATKETASELLITLLERFGEQEPVHTIVLFTAEDGSLNWRSNTGGVWETIGILELAKHSMMRNTLGE